MVVGICLFFFFQAEDGIRDLTVTGVQTCALPICSPVPPPVERAVEALTAGAEKAQRREGIREADRFYARALELVADAAPETTVDLRLRRSQTRTALGEHRQAYAQLLEVAEEASKLGRRDLRMGTGLANAGELAQAEEQFVRCVELAEDLGSLRDQARSTYLLGQVRYYLAGVDAAERLALQARDWLQRTCESYYQIQNLRQLA